MTPEQEKALARARARRRLQNKQGGGTIAEQWKGLGEDIRARQKDAWAADHPVASKAATFLQGLPFVGEYFDEAAGAMSSNPNATELVRSMQDREERENPKTAIALQLMGGITGLVPMGLGAGAALSRVPTMAGKIATGMGAGIVGGSTEGAVSGYGAGEDPDSRRNEAKKRAVAGGLVGGVIGGAAPVVAPALGNVVRSGLDKLNISKLAKEAGLSRPSHEVLTRAMDADGSLSGQGARNIARAGPDAMLADAGPNARTLLDTAIQRSGPASNMAQYAVEGRASAARDTINRAMDNTLVPRNAPQMVDKPDSMGFHYHRAYNQPIDYSAPRATEIEDMVRNRVPESAIRKANELMRTEGQPSKQILAHVADDGSITYERLPDVRQLDYLTRGLNEVADQADGQGKLGGTTHTGRAYGNLSRDIRSRLKELVPEYGEALDVAGTEIGKKQARDFGEEFLTSRVTRSQAQERLGDMGSAELQKLREGIRSKFDDVLANVRRVASDPNMDAREAMQGLRELTSRSAREKLEMAIGRDNAPGFFQMLDQASAALELRAGVAQNSKTFARLNMDETIRGMTDDGIVNAARSGEPLNATKRSIAALLGRSEADKSRIADQTYSEIVRALTERRGTDAQQTLATLQRIARKAPENELLAKAIASRLGTTAGAGAYQYSVPRVAAGQ